LGDSLSGLEIPLLTITNPGESKNKKCIFIIGRQHPGESNSSFVMEGFLKWITSENPEAFKLR
jgi:murein tripeptide amidase MpaA